MAVSITISKSQTEEILKAYLVNINMGAILIDPTGDLLTKDSTKAQIISREYTGDSYARQSFLWDVPPTYDSVNTRWGFAEKTIQFSATSAPISYQQIAIVRDASTNKPKVFDASIITGNALTVTAHGLTNGEAICFTPDFGDTLPPPLVTDTLYFALNTTTNTFQVSTDGLDPLTLTAGSGDGWLKYAKGQFHALITESPAITLAPGQSRTYPYSFYSRDFIL